MGHLNVLLLPLVFKTENTVAEIIRRSPASESFEAGWAPHKRAYFQSNGGVLPASGEDCEAQRVAVGLRDWRVSGRPWDAWGGARRLEYALLADLDIGIMLLPGFPLAL